MVSAPCIGLADAVLDALPDATAVLDHAGEIIAVDKALRMFALGIRSVLTGQTVHSEVGYPCLSPAAAGDSCGSTAGSSAASAVAGAGNG